MINGKYIVANPNILVNNIIITFLFLWKKIDNMCQITVPAIEDMITNIELLGVLLNMSIQISNIFCHIAVDTARITHIGINNHMYFFDIEIIVGIIDLNSFFISFLCVILSYSRNIERIFARQSTLIIARNQLLPSLL